MHTIPDLISRLIYWKNIIMFMNIIDLNKKAWDNIGEKAASPYMNKSRYLKLFNDFCNRLPKNADILDLGCGPGLPVTKELVNRGFNVTGIDISDTMIKFARKNVPEAKYMRISMTDIDFNNEFDGVISSYTMLCLDPDNFKITAERIVESLKDCGLFLLSLNEPSPDHIDGDDYSNIMGEDMYSRPYTEKEIRKIFSALDMDILTLDRETVESDEYGKEYCLMVLLQKST